MVLHHFYRTFLSSFILHFYHYFSHVAIWKHLLCIILMRVEGDHKQRSRVKKSVAGPPKNPVKRVKILYAAVRGQIPGGAPVKR